MAVGGFMFAKTSVKYDATTYPTKRDWGLAVHKARCEAFMKAAKRATEKEGTSAWTSIETELYDEFMEMIPTTSGGLGGTAPLYVQDIHPLSADAQGQYPAFVSCFRAPVADDKGNKSEFMIVTAYKYICRSDDIYKNSPEHGMYIHPSKMRAALMTNSNNVFLLSWSCLSAFAANGFSSYDVKDSSTPKAGQLPLMPHVECFQTHETGNGTSPGYSLVNSPSTTNIYYFGFAVKENTIESFYRTSAYSQNQGWFVSLCGRLFTDDCAGNDWPYGTIGTGNETGPSSDNSTMSNYNIYRYFGDHGDGSLTKEFGVVLDSQGSFYPKPENVNRGAFINKVYISDAYRPMLTQTGVTPDNIPYSAIVIGFSQKNTYDVTQYNGTGLDETGTVTKGFVDTDIMRCVPRTICNTAGATLSNGNFVTLYTASGPIGVIIGWDPTNESMV